MKNKVIEVQNVHISISKQKLDDYICITDIAKAKSDSVRAADVVRNWLRNRGTLEYLSVWEQIYNPNFKVFESEHFESQAGLFFRPSVSKWKKRMFLHLLHHRWNNHSTLENPEIHLMSFQIHLQFYEGCVPSDSGCFHE